MSRRAALAAVTLVTLGLLAPATRADPSYPSQAVRIVVGSQPGSAPDLLARAIAEAMQPILKQPVVVENRPGAAGTLGATTVAQAKPDGYQLLMGTVSNIALAPTFYPIKYKPTESFTPIGMVAEVPLVLVADAGLGVKDFGALSALARAKGSGNPMSYASPGVGGPQHLAGVLLQKEFGVDLLHVPYKSGGAAMTAVAGGETQIAFAGIPAALALLQTGRVVPLFVTSAQRSPALPDVPSFRQAGLDAFEVDNWHALFAPPDLPVAIRHTLESALRTALAADDVRNRFHKLGATPRPGTSAALADKVASETVRWTAIAVGAGLARPN